MTHEHDAGEDKKETGFKCSFYLPGKAFTQNFTCNKESIEKVRGKMNTPLDGDGQKKLWNFLTQVILNFSYYSELKKCFQDMHNPACDPAVALPKIKEKEELIEPQSDPTNGEEKRTFISIFYFSFYEGADPVHFLESLRKSLRKIYPTEFEAIPPEVKEKCKLLWEDKKKKKEPESLSSSSQFPKQNNHQSPKIAPQTAPGYRPQGHPLQGHPLQGHPLQGHPPQGYWPQGYWPQGYWPQGYPLQGYRPQAYLPQAYLPQGYWPQGYWPQAHLPLGYPSLGYPSLGYPLQGYPLQAYPLQAYPLQAYPPRSSSVGSQPTVLKRPAFHEADQRKRRKQGFVPPSSSDTQGRKGEEEVESDNPSTKLQHVQKSKSPALTPTIVLE